MSYGHNNITGLGYVGQDAEMKNTTSGKSVCSFSVALEHGWGESKGTSWIRVTCWEKLAEIAQKYALKGTQVHFSGELVIRDYEDRDGNKRTSVEVTSRDVVFLGKRQAPNADDGWGDKQQRQERPQARRERRTQPSKQDQPYDDSEQIPF